MGKSLFWKGLGERLRPKSVLTAVILAGGRGERMGADVPKQFLDVAGIPAVVRSLLAFQNCEDVGDIVIVSGGGEKEIYREYCARYGLSKVRRVTVGGKTRQESAMAGLRAVRDDCDYIAIHDAARCLVTPEQIHAVYLDAKLYGAAAAACLVKDTIKIADSSGFVESTPERARTWAAQTPQIFKVDLYRAAAYTAQERGTAVTDDCMLAEAAGFRVKLTDCGYENIKLTTPDDLLTAEQILAKRTADAEKEETK